MVHQQFSKPGNHVLSCMRIQVMSTPVHRLGPPQKDDKLPSKSSNIKPPDPNFNLDADPSKTAKNWYPTEVCPTLPLFVPQTCPSFRPLGINTTKMGKISRALDVIVSQIHFLRENTGL